MDVPQWPQSMRSRCTFALLAVALSVIGCSKKEPKERTPDPLAGSARSADSATVPAGTPDPDAVFAWYRVEASIDEHGKVPFVIGVHRDKPEGVIYSAEERLPLVVLTRDPLRLRVPVRGVELELFPDGTSGRLHGQWFVEYYFKRDFDLVAEPIAAARPDLLFPGGDPPSVDLSGEWRFDIQEFGVGRGHFRQDAHGTLLGTLIPPEVGDLRYLTGRVTGARAQLSAYDGMHGFYLDMTASDGGKRLEGAWLIAGIGKVPFTATRERAPETHLKVSARMAPGKTKLTSLPDLEKPPYAGNPVIVDYFGSWCPVCLDLTPELVRLHEQHAAAGLQIYSIALEPPGNEEATMRRLDEFRAAFGMTWPFHTQFTEDFNGAVAKEVLDATGFPVTIFLRRDHTVAAIHTGFVSKAAGAEHAAVVKQLSAYAAEIVASPPAPARR